MCSFPYFGIAQSKLDEQLYNHIVEIAEQTIEADESQSDFNTCLENLVYFAKHPINLNASNPEDLLELGLFTDIEVQKIIQYRTQLNGFVEINELFLLGFSADKIANVSIFLTVSNSQLHSILKKNQLFKSLDHQFFVRQSTDLEKQKGYLGAIPNYQGSPNKYYVRYASNFLRKIQFGVVLEKDEGESFYLASNKAQIFKPLAGFDYRNTYLSYKSESIFKHTILGAYTLQLGQGLLSWSGLALGKSVYSLQAKKTGAMLRPYTSANENLFFKGVATQIQYKKIVFLPYISFKKRDATAIEPPDSLYKETDEVSALPITGLHRTASEIANEGALEETILGLSVSKSWSRLELRTHAQTMNYNKNLIQGDKFYQLQNFYGNQLSTVSIDYKYLANNCMFFGEHAIQSTINRAHLLGFIWHLDTKLDFIALYRNYSVGYYAPYSNGFGESRGTKNEKGVFVGFEFRPIKKWVINGYLDVYKKPWLTSNTSAPSNGTDVMCQVNHQKDKYFMHYLRLKYEINQNNNIGTDIRKLQNQEVIRVRYHLNYSPLSRVELKSRIELTTYKSRTKNEFGTLLYQDIKLSTLKYTLDWSARIAFFDTPSFSTAIYGYESDVLYFFSVPAYYGRGSRYYLMASYDISKSIKIWLRYSRWIYTDTKTISSGNSEIPGDTKSEIRVQLRWIF